ncbi:MAG: YecH family protein [Planctomycetes bacterium]|nr:YecH family protein [Planctomycetota bacterium]
MPGKRAPAKPAKPTMVHGHDVLTMMADAGRSYTRAELVAAIHERFGPEARFHTCSAEGMTAAQLVDFLESRRKFIEEGGKVRTERDRICGHGDG